MEAAAVSGQERDHPLCGQPAPSAAATLPWHGVQWAWWEPAQARDVPGERWGPEGYRGHVVPGAASGGGHCPEMPKGHFAVRASCWSKLALPCPPAMLQCGTVRAGPTGLLAGVGE